MTGNRSVTAAVFAAMLREEWRRHSRLFGGRRFALFPVFVGVAAAAAVLGLDAVGISPGESAAGLHVLAFLFGLFTGTSGLVGRDAMRDLLGDVTLVLFTTRTLPLSRRRVLAVFLVSDLLYYAVLFVAPLAAAFLPLSLTGRYTPGLAGLLWVSMTAVFAVGVVVTFAGVACSTRGRGGRLGFAGLVAAGVAAAWLGGVDPHALTIYRSRSLAVAAATAAVVLLGGAAALAAFDPAYRRPARTGRGGTAVLETRLPFGGDPLFAKTMLDVRRSSGGLWKVPFSAGIVFAVTYFLVGVVALVTGVPPSTGLSFGALLGLTGFTTYNWLTQFDDDATYRALPVSVDALYAAKYRAFLVLGPPTGLAFLAVAVGLRGGDPATVAAGALLTAGLSLYLFGLTVALTGLSPNEFLFDTARFAAFTLAVAVPLVPLLVVAFVVPPDAAVLLGTAAAAVVLGAAGLALYRRAVPRWTRRYRAGET